MELLDDYKFWYIGYETLRKREGLTLTEIAKRAGFSKGYLSGGLGENPRTPISLKAQASISTKIFDLAREKIVDTGREIFLKMRANLSDEELAKFESADKERELDTLMLDASTAIHDFNANITNIYKSLNEIFKHEQTKEQCYSKGLDSVDDGIRILDTDFNSIFTNTQYNYYMELIDKDDSVDNETPRLLAIQTLQNERPQARSVTVDGMKLNITVSPILIKGKIKATITSIKQTGVDPFAKITGLPSLLKSALGEMHKIMFIFDLEEQLVFSSLTFEGVDMESLPDLDSINRFCHERFIDGHAGYGAILDVYKFKKPIKYSMTTIEGNVTFNYTATPLFEDNDPKGEFTGVLVVAEEAKPKTTRRKAK